MRAASPCTGICKIDGTTGWCLGCGRSRLEMDDWRIRSKGWRQRIWKKIPQRLDDLGVTCRRFPWTTEEIRNFVLSSLSNREGTWVMGIVGALAGFKAGNCAPNRVDCIDETVISYTQNGAIRLLINDNVRALTFDTLNGNSSPRVVLAVKRDRGRLPMSTSVADLGDDPNPLIQDNGQRLFDLGLGRKEARFCVRVNKSTSERILNACIGITFSDALPRITRPLLDDSPTRVVETALGRIEVQGQIPPSNASSPVGPHTHLSPNHLSSGRTLPIGMELPRSYLPGAIFYPNK